MDPGNDFSAAHRVSVGGAAYTVLIINNGGQVFTNNSLLTARTNSLAAANEIAIDRAR